jgi:prepilin-type N-terminal cleavage/methylation domain-containing protein
VARPVGGAEAGFTLIELMIALAVLIIGIAGILTLQVTQLHATAFSRHAGEAALLGERKLEGLRTQPIASACTLASHVACTEQVDALGNSVAAPQGYSVEWYFEGARPTKVTVVVGWQERQKDAHNLQFTSQRFE